MKTKELQGSYICYDSYSLKNNKDLKEFLNSDKLKEIITNLKQQVIIVLGWDWTMLRAIKENYDKDIPFLWINFWHKWFLLNSKESIFPEFNYVERRYPLIEVSVWINWETKKEIAVNEVDIRAGSWRAIGLDINLSKRQNINISGDWIIISTPAWSTWYNRSLGWPIIPHTINAFSITPKAPLSPRWQWSILIEDLETIRIQNTWRLNPVNIYCDWREFLHVWEENHLDIFVKKSNIKIRLIISWDYLDTWDNKVLQEQGFQV